jgi:hypothetical protein
MDLFNRLRILIDIIVGLHFIEKVLQNLLSSTMALDITLSRDYGKMINLNVS